MSAGQSPLDFLHRTAPQLAAVVEETQARAVLRGSEFSVRGYSAPAGDLHIVQISEVGTHRDRAFTLQFNPSGTIITTEYGEGAAPVPKAPVVALEGSKERLERARYPNIHADTLSGAAARTMLGMWQMQMLPLKLSAAALEGAAQGWAGGPKPAEVVELQVGEQATTPKDRRIPTNPSRLSDPVQFDSAEAAAGWMRAWMHRSIPMPSRSLMRPRRGDSRPMAEAGHAPAMKPGVAL
ncbi:MAG: hypothetical protein KI792_07095 [Alphaproteobacteria bacterium]|nr:hypothetical protein [Alphaproteobacteria bacterium SS10]